MKDQVLCVDYFAVQVDDKPGAGAELWKQLAKGGVNLLATHAFPKGAGKTQVDLVPENPDLFRKTVSKLGLAVTGPKQVFLVHGTDKPGAVGELMDRLGQKGINVHASSGLTAGGNRYGLILWVDPADVEAATRLLGASVGAHPHA